MIERGQEASASRGEFDPEFIAAVDELSDLIQQGRNVDVEAYARRFPDQADHLRQLVETLRKITALGGETSTLGGEGAISAGKRIGEFALLREIGRGGMGIVYEAEQVSIRRRVALKILPLAAVMDPRQVQRFKNEVQAAALLQHQNIVPVYSVGCEQGVHYYAMQFVEGHALSEIIASLRSVAACEAQPTPSRGEASKLVPLTAALGQEEAAETVAPPAHPKPDNRSSSPGGLSTTPSTGVRDRCRAAAKLIVQAAEALDHAHERGVLHRDVKPGNLMVDATGNLWVADFGLARLETSAEATMTGQVLGTLRYMSPEQATGRRAVVDHRADIYSLGSTLYELCALRPAFDAGDRSELLHQILFESPRSLRKVDPAIPRELETIVSKAMEKSPTDRYETAQELADDLRRYLDHRPILARPPSASDRLRKWALRNRRAVTASVAVAAVFLLLIVAGLAFHARSLQTANAELISGRAEIRQLLYLADMKLAFQAWDRRRLDELRDLLRRHEPQTGEVDVRGKEWQVLSALAKPLEPVVFRGHEGPVREIALIPGGEEFVSVGDDGTIRHWSIRDHRLLRTIESESDQLHAVAVSPDGIWLATGNPTLQLWNLDSGEKVRDLTSLDVTLESIAFAPDGESIAGGWRYDEVRVVSLDGTLRAQLPPTGCRNETLAFSRDGSKLFVPVRLESGHVIREWQVEGRSESRDLGQGALSWDRVAVSSDDSVCAAVPYSSGQVFIVDNRTGQTVGALGTSSESIRCMGFSPRGNRVAWGMDDGMLSYAAMQYGWQNAAAYALSHAKVRTISAHSRKITDVEYLAGDRVLTCSEDGEIKLWDFSQSEISVPLETPAPAFTFAFSPDGKLIAAPCSDGRLWLADAFDGREATSYKLGERDLDLLAFLPGGDRIAVTDDDGKLVIWDRSERRIVAEWSNPNRSMIRSLAVSPNGNQMASAAGDQQLRIHDVPSLSVVHAIRAADNVMAVAYSPDGNRFAWGGQFDEITLCTPGDWAQPQRIPARAECLCLAFAHQSDKLAAGLSNGFLQIMDARDGSMLFVRSSSAEVRSLAWSPDDRLLVSTHRDGTLRVWHAPTATELGVLYRGGMLFSTVSFSPDGSRLAAFFELSGESQAILWKLD